MGTTKDQIRSWVERGKRHGASHVAIVCDTFDYEDFPVEVMPNEDVEARLAEYRGNDCYRIMEVYKMSLDLESQLSERRAHHI